MQRVNDELVRHRPLCVDLDGTLVRTDLLIESTLRLLKRAPWIVVLLPLWLVCGGRARLKREVALRQPVDAASLPYDRDVIAHLEERRNDGVSLVLATAADRLHADAVAGHLAIFDEVHASDGRRNLSGTEKGRVLAERFGDKGFDYAGNEGKDLAVWKRAGAAIVVGGEPGLAERAARVSTLAATIDRKPASWRPYMQALRLHQWLKNALILVPLVLAHKVFDVDALVMAAVAFVAFGLTASSVYVLNDLADLAEDRCHPNKRSRPFAAGDIPLRHGLLMVPALLAAAFTLSLALLPLAFSGILAIYLAATAAYSFGLKRAMLFDVLTLAGLYTLRIVAGSAALALPRSFWLLAFSVFLFFSLALVKRYVELRDLGETGRLGARGRGYRAVDLETLSQFGISSGMLAVLVLALYIDSGASRVLYRSPELIWLLCPLMLYLVCRFWILARRGEMHEDPIVFAIRDWRSQLMVGAGGVLLLAAAVL